MRIQDLGVLVLVGIFQFSSAKAFALEAETTVIGQCYEYEVGVNADLAIRFHRGGGSGSPITESELVVNFTNGAGRPVKFDWSTPSEFVFPLKGRGALVQIGKSSNKDPQTGVVQDYMQVKATRGCDSLQISAEQPKNAYWSVRGETRIPFGSSSCSQMPRDVVIGLKLAMCYHNDANQKRVPGLNLQLLEAALR